MRNTEAENPIINPVSIDEHYIHVVAAIIWHPQHHDRFLIAQRQAGKHLQGYWEFPGGKLETGETPWQGLVRELAEEINICAKDGRPLIQVYYRYPERNVLLDTWDLDCYSGEPSAGERQALRWIDRREIENYEFPPADLPILDLIRRSARA